MTAQAAWFLDTAGVRDQANPVAQLADKVFHPHGFFFDIQAFLQASIMGRNPSGAGIFVALQ